MALIYGCKAFSFELRVATPACPPSPHCLCACAPPTAYTLRRGSSALKQQMVDFTIEKIRLLVEHRARVCARIKASVKPRQLKQGPEFSERQGAGIMDIFSFLDTHNTAITNAKRRTHATTVDCLPFAMLPAEIWHKILQRLAHSFYKKVLVRLGQTCRSMQPLVAPKLYLNVTIRSLDRLRNFADTVASNPGLAGLVRNFTNNVVEPHGRQLRRICSACTNLLSVDLNHSLSFTNKMLRDVAYRCTRLNTLTIGSACGITDDGVATVGKHCLANIECCRTFYPGPPESMRAPLIYSACGVHN
ncbi:hypothetical protein BDZ88DRAFT_438863 [Geranomyces variabilis]|nr:hypothetical protein BDZ88DRAFT_438863 [Geranomyces variabilis]